MSNVVLKARDLLHLTEDQIWAMDAQYQPTEIVPIEFDSTMEVINGIEVESDGVVVHANIRYTILSWYMWEFHRWYPDTPLLPTHHLASYPFTVKVLPMVLSAICDSVNKAYWKRVSYNELAERVYQVSNRLYNVSVSYRLSPYVETMSANDYLDVLFHPEVQAIRNKCLEDPTPKSIRTLYEELPAKTSEPGFLPGNAMVSDMNIKSSPIGQSNQCIGIRGYNTDINSYMFRHPILDCFGTGIRNISDFIQESRSASKALLFQKDPIRETEYFNRRLQMLTQPVRWIIPGDCGSTEVLEWHVQPGDLKALNGKYYYDSGNQLVALNPTLRAAKQLVGTTIRMRSPLMCKHKHLGGVCQTCAGQLSYTLPYGTNIGHVSAYTMGEKITQSVLSVKHLDGSTEIKEISLDKTDLSFIRLSTERSELIKLVKDFSKYKNAKMLLPVEEVGNLTQAMNTEILSELSIYKISTLYKVGIRYDFDVDTQVTEWVTVSGPSRPSSLTASFLSHIKRVGYTQEDSKYLIVSLDGWDVDKPVMQLPQKQINMLDFMKQISNMLECGPREGIKKGLNPSSPLDLVTYLRTIYEYANQYISIPIMYLEIATLSGLVRDLENYDLRLAEDNYNRGFAPKSAMLHYRSVGPALAYEEQSNVMYAAQSYNKRNRVPHPMDALFYPNPNAPIYQQWVYDGT